MKKVRLIDQVFYKSLRLPRQRPNLNDLPHNDQLKLSKLLIHNNNIQVNFKTLNYPYLKINDKAFVRKINLRTEYDTSYYNIFKYLQFFKRIQYPSRFDSNQPIFQRYTDPNDIVKKKLVKRPRKTTTYQHKLFLKKNPIKHSNNLDLIVFQAGFAKSLKEARHLIKQGYILVNNRKITSINYIPKNGETITNNHPTALFNYFNQKYLASIPKWSRIRKVRRKKHNKRKFKTKLLAKKFLKKQEKLKRTRFARLVKLNQKSSLKSLLPFKKLILNQFSKPDDIFLQDQQWWIKNNPWWIKKNLSKNKLKRRYYFKSILKKRYNQKKSNKWAIKAITIKNKCEYGDSINTLINHNDNIVNFDKSLSNRCRPQYGAIKISNRNNSNTYLVRYLRHFKTKKRLKTIKMRFFRLEFSNQPASLIKINFNKVLYTVKN